MNYERKEIIGDCVLYQADCLDVIDFIDGVDCVVTDPPYGVMLGEKKNGQSIGKNQQTYTMFSDTPEYVEDVCVKAVNKCISISDRCVITPGGRNMFKYPEPDDFGVWYNPAGTSIGRWGFSLVSTPIFYYGKDPRRGKAIYASSVWGRNSSVADIKNKLHPCPKPIAFMDWLVEKSTFENETVLDPFMGSGTTGISCVKLGRKFIGIEFEPKYFDIACQRIRDAYKQPDMLVNHADHITEQVDLL